MYIFWLVFSGIFEKFFFIVGLCSVLLTLFLSYSINFDYKYSVRYNFTLVLYYLWLLKEIIFSSFNVIKFIWSFDPNINPEARFIKTELDSIKLKNLFANSITLTPGTFTMEIGKKGLFVHALDASSLDVLDNGYMQDRIKKL